jgi:aspartate aminotransferase
MLYEITEKALKLEAEGKRIIKLNIGDPDQPTPSTIIRAAWNAMKSGRTKYSSAFGEKKLRAQLASIHGVSPENVIIAPGSKWAIYSAMCLLLKDGGNVVLLSPYWTAYWLIAKNLGAEIRVLKTEIDSDWRIDTAKFESLLDQNTRLIVLNNPTNPISKAIDEKTLEEIVRIASRRKIKILSDEVYSAISFVQTKSILNYGDSNILVNSFSKTFAMTGWRIGYAVAEEPFIDQMVKINQMALTNVPVFIQEAASKALELRREIAEKIRRKYKRRADLACNVLARTRMRFTKPDAPFYLFPKIGGLDSEKLAFDLLEKGVAITPGTAFGDYGDHFRIALTVPDEEIKLGLEKICEALK